MPTTRLSRLLALALLTLPVSLASCDRPQPASEVVLYSSVDDTFLREFVRTFEAETGMKVHIKGDTEQTKTFGLVQLVLDEKDSPRADVWWSSEPFGSVRLAEAGVLEPYAPESASDFGPGGWPAHLCDPAGLWHGVALRARVIAFNTERLTPESAPQTLRELTDPKWKGRVGIANPLFGTTRGHVGALAHEWGQGEFEAWLTELKANGLRVYDGNAAAVRGVAYGEVDVCITDTDDVWAGQRNNWPVDCLYEPIEPEGTPRRSFGAMTFPTTAGLVKNSPNPAAAKRLLEYILSERAEHILAQTDSHNVPVRPAAAADYPDYAIPTPASLPLAAVADAIPPAADAAARILGLD